MFIRKVKNQAGQTYYHIVESYREGKKVRKRTLLSLGRVEDGNLDSLLNSAKRHKEILTVAELAKSVSIDKTFILGPLLILEKMFEDLGINDALKEITDSHKKIKFDLQKIVFTIVASRFVQPGSKLKIFEHWQNLFYPDMLEGDIQLHQFYRAIDLLSQHKDDIEMSLFHRDRDLFNRQVDIVLYDLTTLRFESTRTDLGDLRQFGYSKEMRSDCTQVIFGLLVDRDGIPLGFEVYPGNTFEGHTISSIVDKMRKKFCVGRFIFVADRGLFSKDNLRTLSDCNGEFIVGMKLGTLKKDFKEDAYNIDNFSWVIKDELAIYEKEFEKYRCIVTWSCQRAKRDRKIRSEIIEKVKKKLSSKSVKINTFISNKGYKKYVHIPDSKDQKPILNVKFIDEEEKKDGFFAIVTNVKDVKSSEILKNYKELWKIEDAFGELKGTLKTRPIFHWTDNRIIGHLVLCFLAYLCEAHLTKRLRDKKLALKSQAIEDKAIKPRALTIVEAMKELREVKAIPVKIGHRTVWVRTDIAGNAAALFRATGRAIPPKLLKCGEIQPCR